MTQHDYTGRLARLEEVDDLEVADNDPDVRGWEVVGSGGTRIGQVEELIVDPQAMKVRYLEAHLQDSDRHLLIPIERASLDRDKHNVIVPLLLSDAGTLPACPAEITHDFTTSYDQEWSRRWGAAAADRPDSVRMRRIDQSRLE